MDINMILEIIGSLGFPIACVLGLAWFAFFMVKTNQATNQKNMEQLQARCLEREDKLYEEIKSNREINAQAVATIAKYAESLDVIQRDVNEIKTELTIIASK
jgi:type IV secretory pathway VirD2 relaxase